MSTDILLLLFSHSDVSDSLWPHGLQHSRLQFSSVQSLNCVKLFTTPWIAAHQASLSITNSRSPPKPVPIKSVMPSNHHILCHPLLLLPSTFPGIRVFSNESGLLIMWPKYWLSASTSVLPMNTQGWSPLGWTGNTYHSQITLEPQIRN